MSVTLRITLIVVSILFVGFVFSKINKKKLQMSDSLLWLLVSFLLIVVAFFPQICVFVSKLIGIETPSNFVYLICVGSLFVLLFRLTTQNSRLEKQTRRLIQTVSIDRYINEKRGTKPHD